MSAIDHLTEERLMQLMKDVRDMSEEDFMFLINNMENDIKNKVNNEEDPRQLQLVLLKTNNKEHEPEMDSAEDYQQYLEGKQQQQ
tara:strand:- start:4690 stop:4944 length:255 start_codon:yes stop_codon:yes gene_type:complete